MSLHIDEIIVEGISGNTFTADTIFLGNTPTLIHDVFAHKTGSTITGDNYITGNLSASTYFSASTNLETIIYNIIDSAVGGSGTSTLIQPGNNTYTGGTSLRPTINVTALTVDSIFVSGNSNFNSVIGSGVISASTVIENVLTPKGTLITINRNSENIISGLTKNNGIYGIRNMVFHRNSENKITGWTVSA
jgi:hypothetical protein